MKNILTGCNRRPTKKGAGAGAGATIVNGESGMKLRFGMAVLALIVLAGGSAIGCGTKTDSSTGMRTTSSRLACDTATLTMDDVKLTSNKIPMGKKIVLRYDGVRGFKKLDGRVFPGASMSVTEPGGATIGQFGDLFSQYTVTGMDPKKAGRISLTLSTGKPMKTRAEYIWKARVWDKKGKGEIVSEMKINVL
jgi:hypothetical protein